MGCPIEDGNGAELIVAYGAGSLTPEQAAAFEQHLAVCAKCRKQSEAQRVVWAALDTWPAAPVSQNFDVRLYQRIAREDGEAWWRRLWPRRFSWRPVAPAAVACAAVIAAFLLKSPLRAPDAASHNEPKLQIEQVEHALDDMEMLKQLSVDNSVEPAQSREKI